MGNDYNNITITGNIVKDPELTKIDERTKCNLVVCIQRRWKKDGKDMKTVDYLNVVAWGKLAETCSNMTKGSKVLVNGMIQLRSYMVDKETKWITEIVADSVEVMVEVHYDSI